MNIITARQALEIEKKKKYESETINWRQLKFGLGSGDYIRMWDTGRQ